MTQGGASRDRARVVVVTGAPGSGKSTLGTELSRVLRMPFITRDDVRGGLFFTAGAWSARPRRVPPSEESVEALLRIVEATASLGVSCIVEYVVRQHRPADIQRLSSVADCVVVLAECRDHIERFASRNRAVRLLNRQPVLDALGYATIIEHTSDAVARMRSVADAMRVDFRLPTLMVNTDDGYEPGLDAIVDFVITGMQPTP
jgi:predicted kinase